jgi:hypothetical protein
VMVPVPPGFRADRASLEALVRRGVIDRHADQGSELHFYLSALAPGAKVTLPYQLEATAECDVAQRAAHAYAYYSPEVFGTSAATRLIATPRPR